MSQSLSFGPLVESGALEQFGEVVDMKAVAQTRRHVGRLDRGDTAVAVAITRYGAMENPERDDFGTAAVPADHHDLVAVLCLTTVPVMHHLPS